MSTLPVNSVEFVNTNQNIQPQSPKLVLVKDGPFKGRQVALIPLDNPAGLDPEIAKNKLLANKESNKACLWTVAYFVVACVVAAIIGLGSFFSGGALIFVLAPIIAITAGILGNFLGILPKISFHRHTAMNFENTNEKLEECKKNMVKNEFKAFTRDFGSHLSIDHHLRANRLFERAEAINHLEGQDLANIQEKRDILQANINQLRREIQALQA